MLFIWKAIKAISENVTPFTTENLISYKPVWDNIAFFKYMHSRNNVITYFYKYLNTNIPPAIKSSAK